MKSTTLKSHIEPFIKLLRWNKPSGRLILLIPAGWSLWLTPSAPPEISLVTLILAGSLFISGAGCIANDLWDKNFDKKVSRTKSRPLALGTIKISTAWLLLFLMLLLSLVIVLLLPIESRAVSLKLSLLALPLIIVYPSAKRWFKFPQAILSLCWGFSVLIPWGASQSIIEISVPLISCWLATMIWTFGFDTVYAMADKNDDANLKLNSSALTFGGKIIKPVSISYGVSSLLLGCAAFFSGVSLLFWPFWAIASIGMQKEIWLLKNSKKLTIHLASHFSNQVRLGGLILLGLIVGKI